MGLPQLDSVSEQLKVIGNTADGLAEEFASAFTSWIAEAVQVLQSIYISSRRAQLYLDLSQKWWMPDWLARRLSVWCPERWLPELRRADNTKGEASEEA